MAIRATIEGMEGTVMQAIAMEGTEGMVMVWDMDLDTVHWVCLP